MFICKIINRPKETGNRHTSTITVTKIDTNFLICKYSTHFIYKNKGDVLIFNLNTPPISYFSNIIPSTCDSDGVAILFLHYEPS